MFYDRKKCGTIFKKTSHSICTCETLCIEMVHNFCWSQIVDIYNSSQYTHTPITKKECFVPSVCECAFIFFETEFRLLYKGIHSMARCLLFISAFFLDSSKIRSMRQIISNYAIQNKESFSSFVYLFINIENKQINQKKIILIELYTAPTVCFVDSLDVIIFEAITNNKRHEKRLSRALSSWNKQNKKHNFFEFCVTHTVCVVQSLDINQRKRSSILVWNCLNFIESRLESNNVRDEK